MGVLSVFQPEAMRLRSPVRQPRALWPVRSSEVLIRLMTSDPLSFEEENQARCARLLLRRCDRAALATSLSGAPYASLVLVAADLDGSPLLLLSDLAQATRNLKADPRISLVVSCPTSSSRDLLDSPRLSLLGQVRPTRDPRHRRRFLARQPQSALYADFRDFGFYRMTLERAHFIRGFGSTQWIKGQDFLITEAAQRLAEREAAIAEYFNRDKTAELDLCISRLTGSDSQGWQVIGIDPDGIDVRGRDETARLDFAKTTSDEEAVRAAFAELVAAARRAPAR
jgi:heme iron utilization protein